MKFHDFHQESHEIMLKYDFHVKSYKIMRIPLFLSNRENINISYGLIGVLAAENVNITKFHEFLTFS